MDKIDNNSLKIIRSFVKCLSPNEMPANVLAEVLDISVDIAYRRINGKVPLTLDEAVKLCKYAGISLDKIFDSNDESIHFLRLPMFDSYSITPLKELISFVKSQITRHNAFIFSASANFPLGHFFNYPSLMALRIYHFKNYKSTFKNLNTFSLKDLHSEQVDCFDKLAKLYTQLDTFEFWCDQTFLSVIMEIKYYKSLNLISAEDEKMLVDDFNKMLYNLEYFAGEGKKENSGRFELYIVPYNLTNSVYLSYSSSKTISYFEMNLFDYAFSAHETYCAKQKEWFEGLMNYSVCISNSNLKQRKLYFDKIRKQLEEI